MGIDFAEQRRKMVDGQLITTDVTDKPVLLAMSSVPREQFVSQRHRMLAYLDEDIEVSAGRYILEPSPFAKLLQLAMIRDTDVILDVGAATGYSTAVLSRIGASVIGVEQDDEMVAGASEKLAELGYDNAVVVGGAPQNGYSSEAPYDVIVIEGSVEEVPQSLFDQLREGGRLVAVVGRGHSAVASLFVKDNGIVSHRRGFNCAVPPLPGFEKAPEFVF